MDTNNKLNKKNGKNGFVVVWFVIAIPVILLFALMAIDFGYMYMAKGQLQNAADSAALAGAGVMTDSPTFNETTTRKAATDFAYANKAADKPYVNIKPTDVVFGHWTSSNRIFSNNTPYNAVKVTASRTADSLDKQVPIVFGRYWGWDKMSTSAQAVALSGEFYSVAPIVLCPKSLGLGTTPTFFELNPTSNDPTYQFGSGWTTFQSGPQSTSDSRIRDFIINNMNTKRDYCSNPCIETDQGTKVSALNELKSAFNTYKTSYSAYPSGPSWRVLIPIVDGNCPIDSCMLDPTTCTGCPPGNQNNPNKVYHIAGWAVAYITYVGENPSINGKYGYYAFTTSYISCSNASPTDFLRRRPKLVDFIEQ